jgi:hypothetical protein
MTIPPTLEPVEARPPRQRRTPQERRRQLRRRRMRALVPLAVVLALVGAAVAATAHRGGHRRTITRVDQTIASHSPFASVALQQFLLSRTNDTEAAVYDVNTNHTYVYRADHPEVTASIMKVDILASLLWLRHNQSLSGAQRSTAAVMIRDSDNDAAQHLWNAEGDSTVQSFDGDADMDDTSPNLSGYWGLSTTTARDQIELLQKALLPNELLSLYSRRFIYGLMRHIRPDQDWGVSTGVADDATVALKNGWLERPNGLWQVNSIGSVTGDGRHYLIAVLTASNSTEQYGQETIGRIAAAAWQSLDTAQGGSV